MDVSSKVFSNQFGQQFKKVGIAAGKEALQAGSKATRDYLNQGTHFKEALKHRGKQPLGRTVGHLGRWIGIKTLQKP